MTRPTIRACRDFTAELHDQHPDLDAPTLVEALRYFGPVDDFSAGMIARELRRILRIESGELRARP